MHLSDLQVPEADSRAGASGEEIQGAVDVSQLFETILSIRHYYEASD